MANARAHSLLSCSRRSETASNLNHDVKEGSARKNEWLAKVCGIAVFVGGSSRALRSFCARIRSLTVRSSQQMAFDNNRNLLARGGSITCGLQVVMLCLNT